MDENTAPSMWAIVELMGVWNKPRVTWDGTKLDGLMIALPAIAAARKVGEPSCTIRKV